MFTVVSALTVIPAKAQEETGTAGSNFGKGEITEEEILVPPLDGSFYSNARTTGGTWILDDKEKKWWYRESDGTYPRLSWRNIDGTWYYFDYDGWWIDNNKYEKDTIKGIDVSEWQAEIDWQAVKDDGVEFAIIRAGGYGDYLDKYFDRNMKEANRVGMPVGVYFYTTAQNEEEARSDAQFVIDHVTGYTVSYPIAIDLEDSEIASLGADKIAKIAKAFCDEISKAGYTPMVYTNEYWYKDMIDMEQLEGIELWIARYNNIIDENIPRAIWQCCSTGRYDGIEGDVDTNFAYKDFTETVTPRTEPAADYVPTPISKGEWKNDGIGWWYRYKDGSYPKSAWETIDGQKYWFDKNGYMVSGWQVIDNTWYYFESSGAMHTGWLLLGNTWYYLHANGKMATGWLLLGDTWYYLHGSGAMATGWLLLGDTWYYLNAGGDMATGWLLLGNTWYYLDEPGYMHTGWLLLGDTWYYLNAGGDMATGWLLLGNTWYYLSESGAMVTGTHQINGTQYSFNESGAML